MLLLTRTKKTVRICESWFAPEKITGSYDVVFYRQCLVPIKGCDIQEYATRIISLSVDEEHLFEKMRKNFRYEIRRAEQSDVLECEFININEDKKMVELKSFYDEFAQTKSLQPLDEVEINRIRIAGGLRVSCVSSGIENLVFHVYVEDGLRARLLHSFSVFRKTDSVGVRNLVGRANRYLHWWDMLQFKKEGFALYDLGGWYTGKEDKAKLSVNDFKEGFGGDLVIEYNCSEGLTLKGKIALLGLKHGLV